MCAARIQNTSRRLLLVNGAALLGAALLNSIPYRAMAAEAGFVEIENFSAAGKSLGTARVRKLVKTDAQWKALLSPESFEIARHAGTEPAFTGIYWNNRGDGLYRCICCDTALYDSHTKFESGTGWPSFYRPISRRNIVESPDYSFMMERTAISCTRCDAHLGHVFDDGPKPTGLRYCMNSAALKFIQRGKDSA